jgi:hypothetical protein
VNVINEEKTLQQILAELREQTRLVREQVELAREQNHHLRLVSEVVSKIWEQIDDTPVGFKITTTKL